MEPMTFEEWKKQYADVLKRRREDCQECGGRGMRPSQAVRRGVGEG